jgi:hypothetical protein
MTSIGNMIKRIDGLRGTKDITPREEKFIGNIVNLTNTGENTSDLSEARIEWITDIFNKHFAG